MRPAAPGRPVRRTGARDPCRDAQPGWRVRPGSASAAGSRAYVRGGGCSAERCACPCSRRLSCSAGRNGRERSLRTALKCCNCGRCNAGASSSTWVRCRHRSRSRVRKPQIEGQTRGGHGRRTRADRPGLWTAPCGRRHQLLACASAGRSGGTADRLQCRAATRSHCAPAYGLAHRCGQVWGLDVRWRTRLVRPPIRSVQLDQCGRDTGGGTTRWPTNQGTWGTSGTASSPTSPARPRSPAPHPVLPAARLAPADPAARAARQHGAAGGAERVRQGRDRADPAAADQRGPRPAPGRAVNLAVVVDASAASGGSEVPDPVRNGAPPTAWPATEPWARGGGPRRRTERNRSPTAASRPPPDASHALGPTVTRTGVEPVVARTTAPARRPDRLEIDDSDGAAGHRRSRSGRDPAVRPSYAAPRRPRRRPG